jgi:RNA polymerase sigma-70 factor (ECF subfamily)
MHLLGSLEIEGRRNLGERRGVQNHQWWYATSVADVDVTAATVRVDADASLVTRAAAGDRDAFAALIAPRADRALRVARAILGSDEEAHDAAQEALVAAWVHLPRLRDPARFDAWLHRTLINACREVLRRRKRSREIQMDADAPMADFSGGSLETASVKAAFGRLSVDERSILLLHHLHGLPLEQVARHLAIPVGTAKSRLWHARRSLERALEAEA